MFSGVLLESPRLMWVLQVSRRKHRTSVHLGSGYKRLSLPSRPHIRLRKRNEKRKYCTLNLCVFCTNQNAVFEFCALLDSVVWGHIPGEMRPLFFHMPPPTFFINFWLAPGAQNKPRPGWPKHQWRHPLV